MKTKTWILTGALLAFMTTVLAACGGGVKLTEQDFTYELTADGAGVKLLAYIGDKGGNLIIPGAIEGRPVVALGDVDQFNEGSAGDEFDRRRFYGFAELPEKPGEEEETEASADRGGFGPAGRIAVTVSTVSQSGGEAVPVVEVNEALGTKERTSRITGITIPDTVTYIGGGAFANCQGLTALTMPKSLTVIGGGAFTNTGLASVTVPKGAVLIGSYAFSGCQKLSSLTLPEGIELRPGAFAGCLALAAVKLPAVRYTYYDAKTGEFTERTEASFEEGAFDNCPGLNPAAREAILASGYPVEFVIPKNPVDHVQAETLGIWVDQRGKTVAVITRERVYLADILRWEREERGISARSFYYPGYGAPNGMYGLSWGVFIPGDPMWYPMWYTYTGGPRLAYIVFASFTLAADGTLSLNTENGIFSAPNYYTRRSRQTFQLRRLE